MSDWRLRHTIKNELGVIDIQTNHLGLIKIVDMCVAKFFKDVMKIKNKLEG